VEGDVKLTISVYNGIILKKFNHIEMHCSYPGRKGISLPDSLFYVEENIVAGIKMSCEA
jgi:hypothetical protein